MGRPQANKPMTARSGHCVPSAHRGYRKYGRLNKERWQRGAWDDEASDYEAPLDGECPVCCVDVDWHEEDPFPGVPVMLLPPPMLRERMGTGPASLLPALGCPCRKAGLALVD